MRFIALFICLSIVGISGITQAQQKDTIRVSNFGAHPYTYENCVTCLQEAISECKRSGARVLSFEKGRYDIWPEGAIRRKYFISNTSTEQESFLIIRRSRDLSRILSVLYQWWTV